MNSPYRHPKIYLTVLVLLTIICSTPGLAWVSDQTCPALINITEPGYYILNPSLNNGNKPIYAIKSSGVTLDGNGQTFLRTNPGCPAIALESPSLSDVHLTNMKLIKTSHDNYYDIDLSGVDNGSISNVHISNLTSTIITIGGSNIDISNNVVDQTDDAIVVSGSHINIHSNTLNDTGLIEGGIDVSGSDIDIHHNVLTKNSQGIGVSGSDISIYSNTLNQNYQGITVSGSDINVYDNILEQNGDGIEISGTDITISNNTLEGNSEGIRIDTGSNVIIKKNSVRNNSIGFLIFGTNFTISDNVFQQNSYGISSVDVSDIIFSKNIFEQNGDGFYGVNCSNLMFLENSAKNNSADVITYYGSDLTFSNNILEQSNTSFDVRDFSTNITMMNNTFLKYKNAISITNYGGELSTKINIHDNVIKDCTIHGIFLYRTNESLISHNTIINNSYGIDLIDSQNGAIFNNSLVGNNAKNYNQSGNGIRLQNTSKIKISNNNLSFNNYGVVLGTSSSSNELTDNIINNNQNYGIEISMDSIGNTFHRNTIQQNNQCGIYMHTNASQSTIYNNFFNNTNNTRIYGTNSQNIWNTTKTPGKNIISGPYLGGNVWAKPDGKGFSQTCVDSNHDGICDTAYTLKGNNTDYLPLSLNNTSVIIIPPVSSKIGVFRPSTHLFYLDYNGNGVWNGGAVDRSYNFGISGDIPVTGDWNNDTKSEIGVFRNSTHLFYLDYNGNGVWNGAVTDKSYNFGISGDIPVSGDWNLDGKTDIGVFRPSTHLFYLDYNGNGAWNGAVTDKSYNFGISGDIPITGDWNLDGKSEIGVFRNSTHLFYLDYNGNGVWNGAAIDRQYNFGITEDVPVTGDWNADGRAEIGVFRPSTHLFYLDYNGNGVWNGAGVDRTYNFGITGDKPVTGKW